MNGCYEPFEVRSPTDFAEGADVIGRGTDARVPDASGSVSAGDGSRVGDGIAAEY